MDGVVREVNVRERVGAVICRRYSLVADSEEKLCRKASEFGSMRKNKVMRCSRYGNEDRCM